MKCENLLDRICLIQLMFYSMMFYSIDVIDSLDSI